jgi:hypothetical protein
MVDRRRPVSRFSDIVISIILSEAGALQLLAASRRRNDGLPGSMCPFLLSMIVADARGGIEFVHLRGGIALQCQIGSSSIPPATASAKVLLTPLGTTIGQSYM